MKIFGILVLSVLVAAALVFLAFTSSSSHDVVFASNQDIGIVTASRKLKDNNFNMHNEKTKSFVGNVNLQDYRPIDPVPSSNAALKAGPIQHGTPLMPYIPKPGPPSHPSGMVRRRGKHL